VALARLQLFAKYQTDFEKLNRILDAYEPAANRIANTVAVGFRAGARARVIPPACREGDPRGCRRRVLQVRRAAADSCRSSASSIRSAPGS